MPFVLLAALLEMYALLFTDNGILIHAPWFSLALLAVIVSLTAMVRSYAWRVAILTFVLVAILSVDAGFILLFDINGTAFDYSLLYQAADGLGMMEGQLVNFGFLVPGAIAVAGFLLYGVFNAVKLKDVKIEKNPRLRIVCCSLAGVLLVSALAVPNVLNFVNTTSDSYYADLLYDNDNEYKKYGVTGDVLYQFVTGPFLTSPKVATWQDSSEFYFRNKTENGELFGVSAGNNVVMILAESMEWFPVTNYPGLAQYLYPNISRLTEESIVCQNHYSREKTDISEAQSLLGNYPSRGFVCNNYKDNAYPFSLPNLYRETNEGAKINSFHNNEATFYNRSELHESLGFDHLYGIEEMEGYGVTNYQQLLEERNLDSEMMDKMKDEMFPADGNFFSYIISYTTHGGYYDVRSSLEEKGYYDRLDKYNVYPETDNKYDNYLRTYAAALMDFDAAIGIMLDDLEAKDLLDSTTIVIYSDHNAYYDRLSYRGKGLVDMQSEIFHVPMFIYDTKAKTALETAGKGKDIEKFTTTADILPTVLTLLGIPYYSNLYFGHNVFSDRESVIFSRAYGCFITEDFVGYSLNSVVYKGNGFSEADLVTRASEHLEKLKYIDALSFKDYFAEYEFPKV